MRPEQVTKIASPLILQSGRRYPPMEVRVSKNFRYTQTQIVGPALTYSAAVYAPAGAHDIDLPFLRVVGFAEWDPRFNLNSGLGWQDGLWELAGLLVYGCRGIRIGRLEVDGLPYGLRTQGASGWELGSARFRRCWKAIDVRYNVTNGISPDSFSIKHVTQVDGRMARDMDPTDQWRSKTGRRPLDLVSGKAGSYITGKDWELVGLVQHGDSFAVKAAGTRYRLAEVDAAHVYLNGVVAGHDATYPGEEYQHLHESKDVLFEDFRLVGSAAATIDHVLLRISFPFTPQVTVRRGTFVKGAQATHAMQVNYARVQLEDCDFVGWPDAQAAFELSPAFESYPAAELLPPLNCRFWPS